MAAATAEDWFASAVKPDASLAEYMAAPPRGMTNPPQNPKVRAALLKELTDLSVSVEPPVWPPPAPRTGPPGPGSVELRWRQRLAKTPSCPAVFGGTSCSSKGPPPLPQVTSQREKSPSKGKRGGKSVRFSATQPSPPNGERKRWIYSSELDGHAAEFEVSLEKSGSTRVGVTTYGHTLLASPEPGTLLAEWNKENPESPVRNGDRIVEVNDVREDFKKMTKQLRKAEVWDLKLVPGWNRDVDVKGQSHGSPTALWRTQRTFFLEDEPTRIAGTAPPGPAPPVGGGRAAGGAEEAWQHPHQKKILARVPTTRELRNAREVLKGQSSLHVSASMDRFRYCADMSRGAPLCISGAGVPSGQPNDIWASDGAFLNMFHNKALRLVNPSNLEPNKEEVETGRRKKRDDEESLDMGDGFKPRYPIDNSLKSLRRLKKQWFPDDTKQKEEEARRNFLKGLMGDDSKDKFSGFAGAFSAFRGGAEEAEAAGGS